MSHDWRTLGWLRRRHHSNHHFKSIARMENLILDNLGKIAIVGGGTLFVLFVWYGVPAIVEADKRQRAEWAAYVEREHCKVIHTEDSTLQPTTYYDINLKQMVVRNIYVPGFKVWQCDGGVTHKR